MTVYVVGDNTGDDFAGTEDTYLQEKFPTAVNGWTLSTLQSKEATGDNMHILLSFSGMSSLPAGTVNSSSLSMYLSGGQQSNATMDWRRLLVSWDGAHTSWNARDGSNNWTTAGAESDGNDRSATVTASLTVGATGITYTWSDAQLDTDVQNILDGTWSNYGWHLTQTGSLIKTFQAENGTDGQRPYLTVDITGGGPTLKSATDSLDVTVTETASLLSALVRSDSLDVSLSEAALILVAVQGADALDLSLAEAANILGLLQRADALDVAIDDQLQALLIRLSRADGLDVQLIEAPDLLVALATADALGVQLAEMALPLLSIQAGDELSITLTETAAVQAIDLAIGGLVGAIRIQPVVGGSISAQPAIDGAAAVTPAIDGEVRLND